VLLPAGMLQLLHDHLFRSCSLVLQQLTIVQPVLLSLASPKLTVPAADEPFLVWVNISRASSTPVSVRLQLDSTAAATVRGRSYTPRMQLGHVSLPICCLPSLGWACVDVARLFVCVWVSYIV
jgi:hypothetical protein